MNDKEMEKFGNCVRRYQENVLGCYVFVALVEIVLTFLLCLCDINDFLSGVDWDELLKALPVYGFRAIVLRLVTLNIKHLDQQAESLLDKIDNNVNDRSLFEDIDGFALSLLIGNTLITAMILGNMFTLRYFIHSEKFSEILVRVDVAMMINLFLVMVFNVIVLYRLYKID